MSDFLPVECGIPQGSILGPLLFIFYVNDLPRGLTHCKVSLFADDTVIYCSANDTIELSEKINEDLEYVKKWLIQNKLNLNIKKTEYILFSTKQRLDEVKDNDLNITIDNTVLTRVSKCRHLGVILDERLSWQEHLNTIHTKASNGLYMLKSIRNIVNDYEMNLVYNSLVLSHLNYCDVVWVDVEVHRKTNYKKNQNRAARIINRSSWYSSSDENLTRPNWNTLDNNRTKNVAIMMYKIVSKQAPEYLVERFIFADHTYNTRPSLYNVKTIRPKTETMKSSFKYRGALTWNNLPHDLQGAKSLNIFKAKLT